MNNYQDLEDTIFGIFGSNDWELENINTYPANYLVDGVSEYIRLNIIPASLGVNINSVSGVLIIDIFTESGKGSMRSFVIADALNKFLQNKSFILNDARVQFFQSGVSPKGVDQDNAALFRTIYSINFKLNRNL